MSEHSKNKLHYRQQAILDYMRLNPAPTIREIMNNTDMTSTSMVRYHLGELEKLGLVVIKDVFKARQFRLADNEQTEALKNLILVAEVACMHTSNEQNARDLHRAIARAKRAIQ